jgi:hypothetical protein
LPEVVCLPYRHQNLLVFIQLLLRLLLRADNLVTNIQPALDDETDEIVGLPAVGALNMLDGA